MLVFPLNVFQAANSARNARQHATNGVVYAGQIASNVGVPFHVETSQDGLTGSAWGDWAAYTDSPLRAFENELGVQA